MNPAIKFLNGIVDGAASDAMLPTAEEAREVIRGFELFPLACGALRTLLEHPDNVEGIAHAKRCLQYLDESNLRALARQAAKMPSLPSPVTEVTPVTKVTEVTPVTKVTEVTPTAEESLDDLA